MLEKLSENILNKNEKKSLFSAGELSMVAAKNFGKVFFVDLDDLNMIFDNSRTAILDSGENGHHRSDNNITTGCYKNTGRGYGNVARFLQK